MTFLFTKTLYAQKNLDIIPQNNLRAELMIIAPSIVLEHKLNERITLLPKVGFDVNAVWGAGGFNQGKEYFEVSFYPSVSTQLRYYLNLQNTNTKGKINKQFGGTYFAIGTGITFNAINPQTHIDPRGSYGLGISLGKQVLKNSGWSFNYNIGYSLLNVKLDGENTGGGFVFGISVGKTLFSN